MKMKADLSTPKLSSARDTLTKALPPALPPSHSFIYFSTRCAIQHLSLAKTLLLFGHSGCVTSRPVPFLSPALVEHLSFDRVKKGAFWVSQKSALRLALQPNNGKEAELGMWGSPHSVKVSRTYFPFFPTSCQGPM